MRLYLSNKSTSFKVKNSDNKKSFAYRPNTTLNLGIGATYKSFTLNLAYGFNFLNPDIGQGKTKYLDLQFHYYGRKVVVDIFGQFYKGYYLLPKGAGSVNGNYYLRPDLSINEVGMAVQYILNYKRFSYRSSFLQTEWQRKSAGSPLIGLELYAGSAYGDSTLFPTLLDKDNAEKKYTHLDFFVLGPNIGYAYTFILRRHFFLMGAASLSINLGNSMFGNATTTEEVFGFSSNSLFRASTGYNSERWALNLVYVTSRVQLSAGPSQINAQFNTSNYRINFVRRIAPGRRIKKIFQLMD